MFPHEKPFRLEGYNQEFCDDSSGSDRLARCHWLIFYIMSAGVTSCFTFEQVLCPNSSCVFSTTASFGGLFLSVKPSSA